MKRTLCLFLCLVMLAACSSPDTALPQSTEPLTQAPEKEVEPPEAADETGEAFPPSYAALHPNDALRDRKIFVDAPPLTQEEPFWYSGQGSEDALDFSAVYIMRYGQILEDKLPEISTLGLLETCMNYPHIAHFSLLSRDAQHEFSGLRSAYDGIVELMQRADAADTIQSVLSDINFEVLRGEIIDQKFISLYRYVFVCVLLSQREVMAQLTDVEKKELLLVLDDYLPRLTEELESFHLVTRQLQNHLFLSLSEEFAAMADADPELKKHLDAWNWMELLPEAYEDDVAAMITAYLDK